MGESSGHQLAALIQGRREEIVRRFVERAQAAGAAEALPDEEVIDSLREYLDELARRLRGEAAAAERVEQSPIATSHGEHRFLHGYDVGAIVREYAALSELLGAVILESGGVPLADVQLLYKHLLSNIADAAVQYTILRDTELRKRTAEHVGFLAHELRNPLSSARMAAGLIRARGDVKPSRAFDALERGITGAAQLLDDALVTVRLGELQELDCTTVELGDLLQAIASDSENDAAAKEITIDVQGGGTIDADPKVLRSAISNLVRNAVKFSHAGGAVQIRARAIEGGRFLVEVEDACGGLPPGAAARLFVPFAQLGKDRSGFGLGLAIAKQATDAHGGQLRVHDLPGKGCVFALELPRRPPARHP
jgi:hypothetical protein